MRKTKFSGILFSSAVTASIILGCQQRHPENEVTIDINDKKQTIQNFGASDAWGCQFVGLWPDDKRNQAADLLFSKEVDGNGSPKGIGLSLWRFNIGAGSTSQQNIKDDWRAAECFLQKDGSYNFSKQAGQQWFLKAAQERGVEKFLAFTNSPPVFFTRNGNSFSSNGEAANIAPENYNKFSQFLVDVLSNFKQQGIPFDYVSPFNEPQWDWTENNQEGSPYTNQEIYAITRNLDSLISKSNLDTKIQIGEAGLLVYLYQDYDKAPRGSQIQAFFNSSSPFYLGNMPNVDKIISGHSYFTTAPVDILREVRTKVAEEVKRASVPIEFWQSEYCILGDKEEVKAEGKDTGIDPALYVARTIHHDLSTANASAWHWWLSISPYDYKDGLIYIDKNKTDGKVEDTKLLWALGNYSRFIKPGAVRVSIHSEKLNIDDPKGIMISSYLNPGNDELVVVAINYSESDQAVSINLKDKGVSEYKTFVTGPGEDEKLKPSYVVPGDGQITIPRRSVITLVGNLK
jgi:O-glycosyl hydrolase